MNDIMRKLIIVIIFAVGISMYYYSYTKTKNQIWGESQGQPYMVIAGQKPTDATVSARVNYFGRGEACSGWAWSASSGKTSKNIYNESFKIEHNFSNDPTRYELRVPYQTRQPEKGCFTDLSDMEVIAKNDVDTVGFATLRIHQAGNDYYNKAISLDSKIEARNCERYYSKHLNIWTDGFGCYYFVGQKKI
ncbi:hypothetical protein [Vibrio sp.]|uniref:hypothetical protein n=1 Tax=Vibrio sp. TaxID=678 RepID=UPI003AA8C1DA